VVTVATNHVTDVIIMMVFTPKRDMINVYLGVSIHFLASTTVVLVNRGDITVLYSDLNEHTALRLGLLDIVRSPLCMRHNHRAICTRLLHERVTVMEQKGGATRKEMQCPGWKSRRHCIYKEREQTYWTLVRFSAFSAEHEHL
jgi:hypothetical protein